MILYNWVTHTGSPFLSLEAAKRLFRLWHRRVSSMAQGGVDWFAAFEPHRLRGYHVHALVAGTDYLGSDDLADAWTWGRSHVERFDPSRGALDYIAKNVGDHSTEFEWSPGLAAYLAA